MIETKVWVALILMEFTGANAQAECNAFYRNYKSNEGQIPQCTMIKKFEGDSIPPPIPRPKIISELRKINEDNL